MNWEAARSRCVSLGGNLASIGSSEENDYIASLARGLVVWLGGHDKERENLWSWTDGTPWVSFQNWARGEPNNANGGEDCVEMGRVASWNDGTCQDEKAFICEKVKD